MCNAIFMSSSNIMGGKKESVNEQSFISVNTNGIIITGLGQAVSCPFYFYKP